MKTVIKCIIKLIIVLAALIVAATSISTGQHNNVKMFLLGIIFLIGYVSLFFYMDRIAKALHQNKLEKRTKTASHGSVLFFKTEPSQQHGNRRNEASKDSARRLSRIAPREQTDRSEQGISNSSHKDENCPEGTARHKGRAKQQSIRSARVKLQTPS